MALGSRSLRVYCLENLRKILLGGMRMASLPYSDTPMAAASPTTRPGRRWGLSSQLSGLFGGQCNTTPETQAVNPKP